MVTTKASECAKWLRSLPNIKMVKPVVAKFCKLEFFGALYSQDDAYLPIETAAREGIVKAGEINRSHRLYLLGKAPRNLNRKPFSRNVFLWKHGRKTDDRAYRSVGVWHRICYFEHANCDEYAMFQESHPFGNNFILGEWRPHTFGYYKDQDIDHYEVSPYARSKMTVEFLK